MDVKQLIHQKTYEKIVYILRRHWVTFMPVIFLLIFLLLVPIFLYFMIENLFPTFLTTGVMRPTGILLASAYYLSIYLFFFGQFIDFYLDVWVVTNDRIVDVEQFGLFSRVITEVDLFRIQDVTTNVKGVFATIFHYGDVHIKTASQTTDIIFRYIPDPNHIREELLRLSHIDRTYHTVQSEAEGHD